MKHRCIVCEKLDDLFVRRKNSSVFDVTRKTLKTMCNNHKRRYRNRIGQTNIFTRPII